MAHEQQTNDKKIIELFSPFELTIEDLKNPNLPEVVKSQYRKKALKLHPDRNPDNPESAEQIAYLNSLYTFFNTLFEPFDQNKVQVVAADMVSLIGKRLEASKNKIEFQEEFEKVKSSLIGNKKAVINEEAGAYFKHFKEEVFAHDISHDNEQWGDWEEPADPEEDTYFSTDEESFNNAPSFKNIRKEYDKDEGMSLKKNKNRVVKEEFYDCEETKEENKISDQYLYKALKNIANLLLILFNILKEFSKNSYKNVKSKFGQKPDKSSTNNFSNSESEEEYSTDSENDFESARDFSYTSQENSSRYFDFEEDSKKRSYDQKLCMS